MVNKMMMRNTIWKASGNLQSNDSDRELAHLSPNWSQYAVARPAMFKKNSNPMIAPRASCEASSDERTGTMALSAPVPSPVMIRPNLRRRSHIS